VIIELYEVSGRDKVYESRVIKFILNSDTFSPFWLSKINYRVSGFSSSD